MYIWEFGKYDIKIPKNFENFRKIEKAVENSHYPWKSQKIFRTAKNQIIIYYHYFFSNLSDVFNF